MTVSETNPSFSIGSFSIAGSEPFSGMLRDGSVIALTGLDHGLRGSVLEIVEHWQENLPRLRSAAERWANADIMLTRIAVPIERLQVHVPYRPRQIFAVGANYRKHVIELIMADPDMRSAETEAATTEAARREAAERMMDERASNAQPYCFNKLPSSVAGPFDDLVIPKGAMKVDWECELAVVIGRSARHICAADALDCVAGFAIANDVTARDLVFRRDVKALGTDWLSSKSQPGFTPFGPYLVPAEFVDPGNLNISLSVNGRQMQDEHSSDMLISIQRQIEYLSDRVQLLAGDIICTGSPAGNGSHHGVFLRPGDEMVASISGLGEQRVVCIEPSPAS